MTRSADPVLARRALAARLASIGKRVGYLLFLAAIVAFVIGFAVGFTGAIVAVITASIIVGSILLAPAIILGYAVTAAEKHDRGEPDGH